jgi:hypothetical protein
MIGLATIRTPTSFAGEFNPTCRERRSTQRGIKFWMKRLAAKFLAALIFLYGVLLWTTPGTACSVQSLDRLIANAEDTSSKYWIASLLVGALLVCIEAYQKRWSVVLFLTIALLAFHPHLTVRAFPMPSCEFASVQGSQAVLAVLTIMLGYRLIRILLAVTRTAPSTSA